MPTRLGKCLCGAVRFRLSAEPVATRICWCRDCQHLAANGTVNIMVNGMFPHIYEHFCVWV